MARNITPFGEQVIVAFEGCRLKAYRCSAGVWTIYVGHTSAAGLPNVVPGMTGMMAEAMAVLRHDLDVFEAGVEKLLKRPASDHEFDALVSLAFNIGLGNLAKSSVLRLHNAGDKAGAAKAFRAWANARGNGRLAELPGLVRRRNSEALIYQGIKDLDFDGRRDPGEPVYGERVAFLDDIGDEIEMAFTGDLAGSAFA
jgi:lysozyme